MATILLRGYHNTEDDVRVINATGEHFSLTDVEGIGIEVEFHNAVDGAWNEIPATDAMYNAVYGSNPLFRVERDSTVDGEFISNVFTEKSLLAFDASILTDQLKLLNNDENYPQVGTHAHISKKMLGSTSKEQVLNFLKLQYFLKAYEKDFKGLSGRNLDPYANDFEWCGWYDYDELSDMVESYKYDVSRGYSGWAGMPSGHNGHSCLIAGHDGNTIEFRFAHSTNDPEKLKNYMLLLFYICKNIKNVPASKCYCLGRVTSMVPEYVMNYWRNKGFFLKTNAKDVRGISL